MSNMKLGFGSAAQSFAGWRAVNHESRLDLGPS